MTFTQKIHQAALLGGLPACMVAMILFRDPSSDQPAHDMPGGANRVVNRNRNVNVPLPVPDRENRPGNRRYREREAEERTRLFDRF